MAKAYSYIRFSTLEQAKGDSLRRQLEATMRLAARRKLQLDDSLKDVGVSGFKGRNKKSGALSRFLAQIEAGKVERGSWLIVESLDRISREDPWDAFATLTQIVNAGVTVATTMPEMVISREESAKNPGLLFLIIGIALRAHEESKMKSYRITKSWEEKRSSKKAGTNQCPAWLRRDGDRGWGTLWRWARMASLVLEQSREALVIGWMVVFFIGTPRGGKPRSGSR